MSDPSRPPLEADLQDLLKRLRTLAGLNRLISGSLELPDVLARIVRAAAALTDAQAVTCWLADERGLGSRARSRLDGSWHLSVPHHLRGL